MADTPLKAIIVEDDPMVAQINSRYLQKVPGLELAGMFGNGQKALEHLRRSKVDLVVLDVYMPELDGLALLRILRQEGNKCEVIMVTAANDAGQVDELLKLGVADYLVKPFTELRFIEALEKCLARARMAGSGDELSQQAIDRMLGAGREPAAETRATPAPLSETPKGLQPGTLDTILKALGDLPDFRGCEEVAALIGLSKVTVRRYLNHLTDLGVVESSIDYDTGGRPSVKYRRK
ncbi:MAG: response regulator [Deltaproteobacteria bacterium]|nr:response regulator [Deltaproteobacteria bacterium]